MHKVILSVGLLSLIGYGGYKAYTYMTQHDDTNRALDNLKDLVSKPTPISIKSDLIQDIKMSIKQELKPVTDIYTYFTTDDPIKVISDEVYWDNIRSGDYKFYDSFLLYLKANFPSIYENMSETQRMNVSSYKIASLLPNYKSISYLLKVPEEQSETIIKQFLSNYNTIL